MLDAAPHVVATVAVPGANWVAVDSRTNTVYVTSRTDNCVYPVDGGTLAVGACITVGRQPYGIAAHPPSRLLYVANFGSASVSMINMDTKLVVATHYPGGSPAQVTVDPVSGIVYVTLHPTSLVARFRGTEYLGRFDIRAEQAFSVAIDASASPRRLYVGTREYPGRVQVFDAESASPRLLASLQPGGSVYNLAVHPADGRLLVMHTRRNDNDVRFMAVYGRNGQRLTALADEDTGVNTFDGGGLDVLSCGAGRIFVAGTDCVAGSASDCAGYAPPGAVAVLDAGTGALQEIIPQPAIGSGPFGVAVDTERGRIYISSKANGGWLNVLEDPACAGM